MVHQPVIPSMTPARFLHVLAVIAALLPLAFTAWSVGAAAQSAKTPKHVLEAVVGIDAHIPGEARTAATLGTERQGSGVVIADDGLVLTIGYLIVEASSINVITSDGRSVPAKFAGYDHASGFGLVRALQPLGVTPLEFGSSDALAVKTQVLIANRLGERAAQGVIVVSRRRFVGAWEYLLEDAIFTSPPNPNFSGAALLSSDGRLLGIGSLLVAEAALLGQPIPGNMFVPIDELKPILADLVATGRRAGVAQPWVGIFSSEFRGRVFVDRIAPGGPADTAGIEPGDLIVKVRGTAVDDMASFLRAVWKNAKAGDPVEITVLDRHGELRSITVRSDDRNNWLRLEPSL